MFGGLIGGLVLGLVLVLVFGITFKWYYGLSSYNLREFIIVELLGGLSGALIGGLVGMVVIGLNYSEIDKRTIPNQGTLQSMKNAVASALIFPLTISLVIGLSVGLSNGLILGHRNGVDDGWFVAFVILTFLGPIIALVGGLFMGGLAVIHHFVIRFILYHSGQMPWHYIHFLDYCTDLIFLRRVGGGYIFVHRLLMEHFAAMYTEE